MTDKEIKTGNISAVNNTAPTQINVGSPGSTQIVNVQRAILPETNLEKGKLDGEWFLRIILNQTSGFWDPSQEFRLQVKTTGPFKSAKFVKGLPPVQFNVRHGENKEMGEFYYSTNTAPFKDEPIVLEIISNEEIGVAEIGVVPLAANKQ